MELMESVIDVRVASCSPASGREFSFLKLNQSDSGVSQSLHRASSSSLKTGWAERGTRQKKEKAKGRVTSVTIFCLQWWMVHTTVRKLTFV